MIPVIICGGFGTKMWPSSRKNLPKHFLPIINGKSIFQLNYEALLTHFNPNEIYVSTNQDQLKFVNQFASDVPEENLIIEPEMRNQGPATGLIAAYLYKKGIKDEPFMIVQSDVIREPTDKFIEMILDAGKIAEESGKYITGGIKPNFPVMGVDYLIKGERVSEEDSVGIYKVDKFIWRSTKEETEKLIAQEGALIHTNHTCMTPAAMLSMLERYRPEWHVPLMNYVNGADLETEYSKMPPGPIEDVTEKVHLDGDSLVIELPFDWYDIGTFETLHEYLKLKGLYEVSDNIIDLNGHNNFVKLDDQNKVVALIGVEDLIVVDTGDVLLVCNKKNNSDVKKALEVVDERKLSLT